MTSTTRCPSARGRPSPSTLAAAGRPAGPPGRTTQAPARSRPRPRARGTSDPAPLARGGGDVAGRGAVSSAGCAERARRARGAGLCADARRVVSSDKRPAAVPRAESARRHGRLRRGERAAAGAAAQGRGGGDERIAPACARARARPRRRTPPGDVRGQDVCRGRTLSGRRGASRPVISVSGARRRRAAPPRRAVCRKRGAARRRARHGARSRDRAPRRSEITPRRPSAITRRRSPVGRRRAQVLAAYAPAGRLAREGARVACEASQAERARSTRSSLGRAQLSFQVGKTV